MILIKRIQNKIGQVTSYEIFNKHLLKNQNGSLLNSASTQVVCGWNFKRKFCSKINPFSTLFGVYNFFYNNFAVFIIRQPIKYTIF